MADTSIFSYTNYREFLRDYLAEKVENGLSFRCFAKRAKLNSPNYLQLVIRDKKNLSQVSARTVADGIGLKGIEKKFFISLIELEQARESAEKIAILEKIQKYYRQGTSTKIVDGSLQSLWLNPIIWEMSNLGGFCMTVENIQKKLPGICTKSEIEESLRFLIKNGYLVEEAPNTYKQRNISFEVSNDIKNLNLQKSHLRFLDIAKDKINDPLQDREFQGLTIAIQSGDMAVFKNKIRQFVQDLNQEFSDRPESDAVVRLQISLFKVTGR